MRRKKFWLVLALTACGLVAVVAGPVVIQKFRPAERRSLEGDTLAETNYREIQFRNDVDGIDLAGMLLVPEGEGPFPAVVMIHGSGTSQRDNSWYLTPSNYLRQHGVVVLLPDKRGSEKSGGDWHTASFDDLAGDTAAAIAYLRSQQDVPITKIGVIGMSQGGKIAPVVACKVPEVAFVVNVVGGATPIRDELSYEENHNLRQIGFLPGVSNAVAALSTRYIVHVGQKEFWSSIGNFDPLPYWKQLSIPTLTLYGAVDTNVDSERSAGRLRSLEKPNVQVIVYEGSGHALESPSDEGNRIIRPEALNRIVEFISNAGG